MEKPITVSGLMLRHHTLIEVLVEYLENNFRSKIESFDELKWELEKHIFTEEKGIFECCDSKDKETEEMIKRIIKEHKDMLNMLNKIENKLMTKESIGVAEFLELLKEHRIFEDEYLYPRLDRELNKEQKKEIIKRINEVHLKDF